MIALGVGALVLATIEHGARRRCSISSSPPSRPFLGRSRPVLPRSCAFSAFSASCWSRCINRAGCEASSMALACSSSRAHSCWRSPAMLARSYEATSRARSADALMGR